MIRRTDRPTRKLDSSQALIRISVNIQKFRSKGQVSFKAKTRIY